MGALGKLFSHPNKILSHFFSTILPQLLKLTILLICIACKWYNHFSTRYKVASTINAKGSIFRFRRRSRPDLCECSVCLTEFGDGEEIRELPDCKHVFHRNCVERWLKGYQATCPLCRTAVVPPVVMAEYRKMQAEEEDLWIEKEVALILLKACDRRRCNGFC